MLTPEDFFATSYSNRQRPRAVFTIGIAGSGKSYWCRAAVKQNWIVVNSDSLRKEWLVQARATKSRVFLNGGWHSADPADEQQIFSPELRAQVMNLDFLLTFAKTGRPLVYDITNLTPGRVPLVQACSALGYDVEALVFEPAELTIHEQNVSLRKTGGGLSVSKMTLEQLLEKFNLFCRNLAVDANFKNNGDAQNLRSLGELELLKLERFNSVSSVSVRAYANRAS